MFDTSDKSDLWGGSGGGSAQPGTLPDPQTAPTVDPTAHVTPGSGSLATQIPSLFDAAQGAAYGASNPTRDMAAAMMAAGGGPASERMGAYMNPYTDEVVNRSLSDIDRLLGNRLNDIRLRGAGAGAFGGRSDLLQGEAIRHGLDVAGRTAAGLRSQGFDTALSAGAGDLDRLLRSAGGMAGLGSEAFRENLMRSGALSGLAGQGFDMYNTMTGQQGAYGTREQAMMQAIMDAARSGFTGFASHPYSAVQLLGGVEGGYQPGQTATVSSSPGLLDILSGIAGTVAMFP